MRKIAIRALIWVLKNWGDDVLFFLLVETGGFFAGLTAFTEWDDKKIQQLKDNPEEAKKAIREFLPNLIEKLKKA